MRLVSQGGWIVSGREPHWSRDGEPDGMCGDRSLTVAALLWS